MPEAPSLAPGRPIARADGGPQQPLRRVAIRGALWTLFGFGSSQVLRLGFNLIVTRLLYPELFGLMSLVYTIVTGLSLFGDMGIGPAVIRDERGGETAFLNTAWTIQIARGFGIAFFCVVLAWPVSAFYREPRLLWILPVIGLASIASGFESTCLLTLTRNMEVRRQVVLDVGAQVVGGSVMILWAWLSPSVWALMGATLASAAIRMVWSHWLIPGRTDRLMWEPAAAHAILRFGRWIQVASILTFLASQIDRLILGKLLTWQVLGIYGLASAIAEVPRALAHALDGKVIFPAWSQLAHLSRSDLRERILRNRWPLLVVMALSIGLLAAAGDGIMHLLYDRRYAAGAWMLPVLALGIWPGALSNTIGSALFSIGQPRYAASANACKTIFTAVGIPVGFHMMGVAGALIVVAMNDIPYYGRIAYGLRREGLGCWQQDLKATALLAAIVGVALIARGALGLGMPFRGLF